MFPHLISGYCPESALQPCGFQVLQLLLLFVLKEKAPKFSCVCMFQGPNKKSITALPWLVPHEKTEKSLLASGEPKRGGSEGTAGMLLQPKAAQSLSEEQAQGTCECGALLAGEQG